MAQNQKGATHLAAMIGDPSSQISSLASNERSLVLHLVLTTLVGEDLQLVVDLQEFDRLDEFERDSAGAQHFWVRACLCEQRHQSNFG